MVTRAFKNATNFEKRKTTKPLIINGDMAVAQRSTSVASITSSTYHTVDRFKTLISSLGTWTLSQSTDVPTGQGFSNSLKWDCTTANASPSAGNYLAHQHKIEGQNLQMLKKGTSSAESFTFSFWVKSNKTGTYNVEMLDKDNSRMIIKQYTIDSANTWEKKVLSFAGDTTGAFDNDNAVSLEINMWLGSGSSYSSGTAQTSWGTQTNANRAVGNVNLADSTDNDWYITGVQLEVGEYNSDTIPPFQHETYIENVERCWRYYEELSGVTGTNVIGQGFMSDGSSRAATLIQFHSKRATPTITSSAAGTFTGSQGVVSGGAATGFIVKAWSNFTAANSGVAAGAAHVHLDTSGHSGLTDGQICRMAQTSGTTAFMIADAEL